MKKKLYLYFVGGFFAVSLLMGLWRTLMMRALSETSGPAEKINFDSLKLMSDLQTDAFPYIVLVLLAVSLAFAFLAKKTTPSSIGFSDMGSVFASSLSGFMLATVVILQVFFQIKGGETSALDWVAALFALLSMVFFFYASSKNVDPQGNLFSALALLPTAHFAVRVLDYFLSVNYKPNTDNTLFHLFSLCAFMLFFLSEGKHSRGEGSGIAYIFFGFAAILLTSVYALPNVMLSAFWIVPFSVDAVYSCVEIVVAIFVAVRLFNFCPIEPEKQ